MPDFSKYGQGRTQPSEDCISRTRINGTFANFVVGSANQFAQAAALAVATLPAKTYNPLFIYGGNGLGKTHLLQAIGHHMRQQDATRCVVYVSAERFASDLANALRHNRSAAFRRYYRQADVLLVDDVQFFAGKTRTQEEFFHTFNVLYEANKQLVCTGDRPPQEIMPLAEQLRSRFAAGLIADIQPPDLETRLAILSRKAEEWDISLPHEVAMLIASHVRQNIRELENCLIRVATHASLVAQPIDQEIAARALEQTLAASRGALTVPRIQQAVAEHFGLRMSTLRSKERRRIVVLPRHIAMFLCRELTEASLLDIARDFGGRDHTTVLHACAKIARLEEHDEQVARLLWQLRRALAG
jgi:chromosomal replication initiator protein